MSENSKMSSAGPINFGDQYDPKKMRQLAQNVDRVYAALRRIEAMLMGGETGQALVKTTGKDFQGTWTDLVAAVEGEVATAENVGDGAGVFLQKLETVFQFKSLVPGDNVTITEDEETIKIAAADPGGGGGGGTVDSVAGTTNQIDVDATDPANPVLSLASAVTSAMAQAATAVQPGDPISSLSDDIGLATDSELSAAIAALSTVYQPLDSDLTAISGLATTSFGRGFLPLADVAAARTYLSLVPGTDVQAYSTKLASYAGGDTPSAFTLGIVDGVDAAAWRVSLGLVIGTNVQAFSSSLAAYATGDPPSGFTLSIVDGVDAAAWRTSLGVAIGTDVQAYSAKLASWAGGDTPSAFTLGIVDAVDAAAWRTAIGAGTSSVSITPAALTRTDDTNITISLGGTPATSLLQAVSLTMGWSGTLAKTRGGFGLDAETLTGYVKAAGTGAMTASATIPYSDLTGTPTIPTLDYGTYTPTVTNVSNVSSISVYTARYSRVGSIVTVSGRFDATITSGSSTATEVGISLPIASNLGSTDDLSGVFQIHRAMAGDAIIILMGDITNDRATIKFNSSTAGSTAFTFIFTYLII